MGRARSRQRQVCIQILLSTVYTVREAVHGWDDARQMYTGGSVNTHVLHSLYGGAKQVRDWCVRIRGRPVLRVGANWSV